MTDKYDLYVKNHVPVAPDYTITDLAAYTDQLLAIYQEEMLNLRVFRDKYINTSDNRKLLKQYLKQKVKLSNINSVLLLTQLPEKQDSISKQITELCTFAKKLHEREILLTMNIREITVILKRILQLKDRNL